MEERVVLSTFASLLRVICLRLKNPGAICAAFVSNFGEVAKEALEEVGVIAELGVFCAVFAKSEQSVCLHEAPIVALRCVKASFSMWLRMPRSAEKKAKKLCGLGIKRAYKTKCAEQVFRTGS